MQSARLLLPPVAPCRHADKSARRRVFKLASSTSIGTAAGFSFKTASPRWHHAPAPGSSRQDDVAIASGWSITRRIKDDLWRVGSTDSILNMICQTRARTYQAQLCATVTETAGILREKNESSLSDCSSFDFVVTVALLLWNPPLLYLFVFTWHKCMNVCFCVSLLSHPALLNHTGLSVLFDPLCLAQIHKQVKLVFQSNSEDDLFVWRSSFKFILIYNSLLTFLPLMVYLQFQ